MKTISAILLYLFSRLNPKFGVLVFRAEPTEGDIVTVGKMKAIFRPVDWKCPTHYQEYCCDGIMHNK